MLDILGIVRYLKRESKIGCKNNIDLCQISNLKRKYYYHEATLRVQTISEISTNYRVTRRVVSSRSKQYSAHWIYKPASVIRVAVAIDSPAALSRGCI